MFGQNRRWKVQMKVHSEAVTAILNYFLYAYLTLYDFLYIQLTHRTYYAMTH